MRKSESKNNVIPDPAVFQESSAPLADEIRDNEFCNKLVESSLDGILAFDCEYRYTVWNPEMERISGLKRADLIGRCAFEVFSFLKENGEEKFFLDALAGKSARVAARPFSIPETGHSGFYEARYAPLYGDDGEIVGGLGIIRDITETKRLETEREDLIRTNAAREEAERINARLQEAERRFSFLAETIHEVFYIMDEQSKQMLYVSPGYEQIWGRTCQSLYDNPRSFVETVHNDDREKVLQMIAAHLNDGTRTDIEYRIHRPDGSMRWIWDRSFPVMENGQCIRVVGIAEDITAHKEIEEKLRSESAFRQAIERSVPSGVIALDLNGKLTYVNPGFLRMTGWLEDDLVGTQPPFAYWAPETSSRCQSHFSALLSGQAPREGYVLRFRRKNGERFQALLLTTPFLDSAGTQVGWLASVTDVTRQTRIEEALTHSQQQLNMATDAARIGMWDRDLITGKVEWTGMLEQLMGMEPGSFNGTYEDFRRRVHPQDIDYLERIVEVARQQGTPFDVDYRVLWPDGGVHWMASRGKFIYDRNGRELRLTGTVADVTPRKNIEEERIHMLEMETTARNAAEHANRIKDEFLMILSHELRTPLTPVLGWTKMMRSGTMTPQHIQHGLEVIERNVLAQRKLIEELLDLSRMTAGKMKLKAEPLLISKVLHVAIDNIRAVAQAKNIGIRIDIDSRAEKVTGDNERLQQVFWNVLSNAVKFSPKDSEVNVIVRLNGSNAEIIFRDNGEGIDPEFLSSVFTRFMQEQTGTARIHGGLGLGLSIARHIVQLHGGEIRAASAGKDHGTTITIHLPALPVDCTVATPVPPAKAPAPVADDTLLGMTIVIVDDDADNRNMIALALERAGAMVSSADSAHDGMALLSSERPDVLITDIGMSKVDGYDFLRQIRALPDKKLASVAAVALTAYAQPEDRARAMQAGFLAHVPKPVDPFELVRVLTAMKRR